MFPSELSAPADSLEGCSPRFLTRTEAARRLRIGEALLDQLIRSGELRAVHLRRRVVISETSLRDLER